ncbi:hypothetical protein NKH77_28945 [Streptomyces sp. M19]
MDGAVGWLGTVDLTAEAVRVLELSGPEEVGAAELSRMFWARVKADEWVARSGKDLDALTVELLHLPSSAAVTAARHEETRSLLTAALARAATCRTRTPRRPTTWRRSGPTRTRRPWRP